MSPSIRANLWPALRFLALVIFPFTANAQAQRSPVEAAYRRIPLIGEPAQSTVAQAEHITVETGQSAELMAKFWRGVHLENGASYSYSSGKNPLITARNAGVNLARVAPFALPGTVKILVDGTPQIAWESADNQMLLAAEGAGGVIVSVSPNAALKLAGWQALVKSALLRYGKDPKFGAIRWEFAGSVEQAQNRYAAFALAAREILPDAPIGFRLTAGDAAESAGWIAKLCGSAKLPLDSFAWTVETNGENAGAMTERVRLVLAKTPALKSTRLLPELAVQETANPARLLTLATRMMAFAPMTGSNALLGASLNLRNITDSRGNRNGAGNALALLNRMAGNRLNLRLDRTDVRCLATREPGVIRLLLWRESNAGDALALVRLHGLTAALNSKNGVRIQRFSQAGAPDDATDAENGDLELPLLLGPRGLLLLEITPAPASPFAVSLSAPQFAYNAGDILALTVTLRNTGRAAAPPLLLRSPIPGMINAGNSGTAPGVIAAGQTKTLRYRIFIPSVLGERNIALTAQAGAARAGLQIQVRSALLATVETPRVDLPQPGRLAQSRIRLQNRGALPLTITLHPERALPQSVTVPVGAAGISYTVDLAAPTYDPGVYPVKIALEDPNDTDALETVTTQIGVPVLCGQAEIPPNIDADLSDWTRAERLGMGRSEQASGKAWRGPSDVSAAAFTKWDANYFYFACDVADDVFTPPTSRQTLTQGDSVQLAISTDRRAPFDRSGYSAGDHEFAMALLPNGAVLARLAGKGSPIGANAPGAKVAIRRIGTRTLYEAAIPWSQISGAKPIIGTAFGFAVRINDRDGKTFGAITWNSGMENGRQPGRFPPLRLVR